MNKMRFINSLLILSTLTACASAKFKPREIVNDGTSLEISELTNHLIEAAEAELLGNFKIAGANIDVYGSGETLDFETIKKVMTLAYETLSQGLDLLFKTQLPDISSEALSKNTITIVLASPEKCAVNAYPGSYTVGDISDDCISSGITTVGTYMDILTASNTVGLVAGIAPDNTACETGFYPFYSYENGTDCLTARQVQIKTLIDVSGQTFRQLFFLPEGVEQDSLYPWLDQTYELYIESEKLSGNDA